MKRKRPPPCYCDGYKYPHREGSPDCLIGTFGDPDCTCREEPISIVMIDPPEIMVDRNCPVHGIDPDAEYERKIDQMKEDFPNGI